MLFLQVIVVLFFSLSYAAASEKHLSKKCLEKDLDSCLELTGHFIKSSRWSDAFAVGDALCKNKVLKACTYAGTAAIAKGSAKIGFDLLSQACDGFEPYACQSLADIAKENREDKMRYMYQKRACYYGLSESCRALNKPTALYTPKGVEFYKGLLSDCEDTNSTSCKTQLESLAKCPSPLTKQDCYFIPGDLSIVFRAKLIQDVAKLILVKLFAAQKIHKEQKKRFSYDLSSLLQGQKELTTSKYVFGFQISCTKKYEGNTSQSTSMGVYPQRYSDYSADTKRRMLAFFKKDKADGCFDPSVSFEAYAVGKLDPLDPTKFDILKISRDGDIIQVQDGLP